MKTFLIILLAVLLPFIAIAKDYGPFTLGANTTDSPIAGAVRDTLIISTLPAWLGSASPVGKYVYVSYTGSLAAPYNEAMQIEQYTVSSGTLVLDSAASSSVGPSADWLSGTVVWVMDTPPTAAKIRRAITATKVASGVPTTDYMLYMQNTLDYGSPTLYTILYSSAAAVGRHSALSITGIGEIWFIAVDSVDLASNATDSIFILTNNYSGAADSVLYGCLTEGWDAGEVIGARTNAGDPPSGAHYALGGPSATQWRRPFHLWVYGTAAAPFIIGWEQTAHSLSAGRINFVYWTKGNGLTITPDASGTIW